MLGDHTATRMIAGLFALFALLLVAGCSFGSDSSQAKNNSGSGKQAASTVHGKLVGSYRPTEKVIITKDNPSLPGGCRPREVAGLITNFFDAFDRGDQGKLSRFFVQKGPTPGLYNAGPVPRKGFGTYHRDALLKYFVKRHEHREHLRLLEVAVGKSWWPDGAAMSSTSRERRTTSSRGSEVRRTSLSAKARSTVGNRGS